MAKARALARVLGVRVPDESSSLGRWLISDTGNESFGTVVPEEDMRDFERSVTRDDKRLWQVSSGGPWVTVERATKEREEEWLELKKSGARTRSSGVPCHARHPRATQRTSRADASPGAVHEVRRLAVRWPVSGGGGSHRRRPSGSGAAPLPRPSGEPLWGVVHGGRRARSPPRRRVPPAPPVVQPGRPSQLVGRRSELPKDSDLPTSGSQEPKRDRPGLD